MRLIHVPTLNLREFEGQNVPRYAILSHRWGHNEVLFRDIVNGTADQKDSFEKIKNCCRQAAKDGFDYVWIDTCCIDKSSSAELSEAINAMYTWYQNAAICYVYLSDVEISGRHADRETLVKKSVWFTRGWTLQELIAPKATKFFDSRWVHIGSRSSLQKAIVDVTSIPHEVLSHQWELTRLPIAQRMAWAANRQTTRIEDRAYSLMGIFNVNMPMLYGEGNNAFRRLQEEIVRRSNDHSILLFQSPNPTVFASTPAEFYIPLAPASPGCHNRREVIWQLHMLYPRSRDFWNLDYERYQEDESSTMTSIGLTVSLPLLPWYFDTYIALVAVIRAPTSPPVLCFIFLRLPSSFTSAMTMRMFRTTWDNQSVKCISAHEYHDLYQSNLDDAWLWSHTRRTVIASAPDRDPWVLADLEREGAVSLHFNRSSIWGSDGFPKPTRVITRSKWQTRDLSDATKQVILCPERPYEMLAVIQVDGPKGTKVYLYIGYDENFNLCVFYTEETKHGCPAKWFQSLKAGEDETYYLADCLKPVSFRDLYRDRDSGTFSMVKRARTDSNASGFIPKLRIDVTITGYCISFKERAVERQHGGMKETLNSV